MSDASAENDPAWAEACRREAVIRDLLQRYPSRMTKRAVEDVAWELGLSRTTMYLLIGRYRAGRLASPGVVEIQRAAWVWRTGVGGGGHRTDRLGWSCDTSTEAERGSDDRREIGAVRAIGEGW